ncbi:MAG: 4-hydroxy-tetrahydrodipicolinate synthase [Duncaniella sp.]|uniref:4-hydroxy-tetrahydrodipicolinate synthase n=1 Tax=Duncaniella sp. TaxID=2518496 RepID=UPI0023C6642B|nr:4-hydroxy-tetrahydrodipicolinate synthase [Duncaniella sp.]MDE6090180.1 4-hydroxy-tetrahydrodipicolinate synthase [Duncaniella sp.]
MSTEHLRGMGVALTTPFLENGDIDYHTLDMHLDYLIDGKADYIVALGTTAETPTLSGDEKHELALHILDYVGHRCPVVIGIGGNSTRNVLTELKEMERLDEFDAILSVVPYYNKPTQEGMYRHFAEIAKASPIPIILYNIPGRTGVNMNTDTIIRLAKEFPNKIIGIKEASGNMQQAQEVMTRRPEGFLVISGDDSLAHSMIRFGGDGVISVLGNAYPAQFVDMIHHSMEDETPEGAAKLHQQFSALYSLLFKDGNPAGIKCMLHILFPRYKEVLRLPLVPVTDETRKGLEKERL